MFTNARLKLTFWYLLIIVFISTLFSVTIYRILTNELDRSLRKPVLRFIPRENTLFPFRDPQFFFEVDPDIIEEAKARIALQILTINIGIFIISGFSAFFLAGKTLNPIEKMVEEQKRFIADASHELRTPLTALKTEIEVNLKDNKLKIADAKNLLKSNLEEVNKMQSLSNYLLSLNRYQNLDQKLAFEKLNLKTIIEEALEKIKTYAKEKDINVIADIEELQIEGNQVSLTELIIIFLDNAIKYSKKNKVVRVKSAIKDNHAEIIISDNGIGIKEEDLPYIFDRFYRGEVSRTKIKADGYGLGLSIAKSIIDLHKGKISVNSIVDRGTTFTINLPLKQHREINWRSKHPINSTNEDTN